ncbi:unnamed protein product [Effrenium voratum]|nr:unnamed protein product [Effrenium voratum]
MAYGVETLIRNTFLDFLETKEVDLADEDPWIIDSNPRRLYTDSVVTQRSIRKQLEEPDTAWGADDADATGTGEGTTSSSSIDADNEAEHSQFWPSNCETTASTCEVLAAREAAAAGKGLSGLTTVMIRNVPSRYTQQKLMREINSLGFLGQYDFFYLPVQPHGRGNRGFAFVNFICPEAAERFYMALHGRMFRHCAEAPAAVMPADLQGFEVNAEHYANMRHSRSARRPLQAGRALFFRPLPQHLLDIVGSAAKVVDCAGPELECVAPDVNSILPIGLQPPVAHRQMVGSAQAKDACQVQRFCTYCGCAKPPAHTFCTYCGMQASASAS